MFYFTGPIHPRNLIGSRYLEKTGISSANRCGIIAPVKINVHSFLGSWQRRSVLVGLLVFGLVLLAQGIYRPIIVQVEARAEAMAQAEVFVAPFPGGPYTPEKARLARLEAQAWTQAMFAFHVAYPIQELRIDTAKQAINVDIRNIHIQSRWGQQTLSPGQILANIQRAHQIDVPAQAADSLLMVGTGRDPHFVLSLSPELYAPSIWQRITAALVPTIIGIVIWLLVELLKPHQTRLARLPEQIGYLVETRSPLLVGLLGALGLSVLLVLQFEIARITPMYQGPDEEAQVPVSFAGFHQVAFGGDGQCTLIWADLITVRDEIMPIARRLRLPVTQEQVSFLKDLRENSPPPTAETPLIKTNRHTCGATLMLTHAYNWLPVLIYKTQPNTPSMDYLSYLRYGQILLAYFIYALTFFVIARGRSLLAPVLTQAGQARLKIGLALSLLVYLAIPQMLFMTSVVNDTGYAAPLGIFTLVSVFVFHRWITPILLLIAVAMFASELVAYLALVAVVILWLMGQALNRWRGGYRWLWIIASLIAAGIAMGPLLLNLLDASRHLIPLSIPSPLIGAEHPEVFYRHIGQSAQFVYSFGLLDYNSFFGVLGQLDTVFPERGPIAFKVLVYGLMALLVANGLVSLRNGHRPLQNWEHKHTLFALFILILIPLAVSVASYATFEHYARAANEWGREIQGRYFLPLYLYPFSFLAIAVMLAAQSKRALGVTLLATIALISGVVFYTSSVMLDVLAMRYYPNPEVMAAYRQLLP